MVSTRSRTSNVNKIIQPNDAVFDKDLLKSCKIKSEPTDDLIQYRSTEQCPITLKPESDIKKEPISDNEDQVEVIDSDLCLTGRTLRRKPERMSRSQNSKQLLDVSEKAQNATNNKSTKSNGRSQRLNVKKPNLKAHECQSCGKYFEFYGELQGHKQMDCEYKPEVRRLRCCKREFCSLQSLKRHKEIFHYNIRYFKCKNCGRTFYEKRQLVNHQKNMHPWDFESESSSESEHSEEESYVEIR